MNILQHEDHVPVCLLAVYIFSVLRSAISIKKHINTLNCVDTTYAIRYAKHLQYKVKKPNSQNDV